MATRTLPRLALTHLPRPALRSLPLRPPPTASPGRTLQLRFRSQNPRSSFAANPMIEYDELKPITQQPNDHILLIDVREPEEVSLGSIPSAVNLPLSGLRDAMDQNYGSGDFQRKYAFPKPLPSQNIIFFCRSGKRSATAAELAGEKGYKNVRNYKGSWLDWTKRESAQGGDDD